MRIKLLAEEYAADVQISVPNLPTTPLTVLLSGVGSAGQEYSVQADGQWHDPRVLGITIPPDLLKWRFASEQIDVVVSKDTIDLTVHAIPEELATGKIPVWTQAYRVALDCDLIKVALAGKNPVPIDRGEVSLSREDAELLDALDAAYYVASQVGLPDSHIVQPAELFAQRRRLATLEGLLARNSKLSLAASNDQWTPGTLLGMVFAMNAKIGSGHILAVGKVEAVVMQDGLNIGPATVHLDVSKFFEPNIEAVVRTVHALEPRSGSAEPDPGDPGDFGEPGRLRTA